MVAGAKQTRNEKVDNLATRNNNGHYFCRTHVHPGDVHEEYGHAT